MFLFKLKTDTAVFFLLFSYHVSIHLFNRISRFFPENTFILLFMWKSEYEVSTNSGCIIFWNKIGNTTDWYSKPFPPPSSSLFSPLSFLFLFCNSCLYVLWKEKALLQNHLETGLLLKNGCFTGGIHRMCLRILLQIFDWKWKHIHEMIHFLDTAAKHLDSEQIESML